jgi:nitrite reductase/ring-hydroxylating ferredoxin subunit/DMSO/TMAO reductase YedYZ heme-binding membrane subunit
MSTRYVAVNWNRQKRIYDTVIALAVPGLVALFVLTTLLTHPGMTPETGLIRGFGITALLLLHVILCIGPLCRLNPAFLPLLYNRRHLGVAMCLTALVHASFAVFQFHALGDANPILSVLASNQALGSLAGFPFELLGAGALLILVLMAATSHDFWLSVLTPPIWKALHMLVYVAYALLVGHVALGAMQAEPGPAIPLLLGAGAALVIGLHLVAGLKEHRLDSEPTDRLSVVASDNWLDLCAVAEIPESRARVAMVGGERVAVFRHGDKLSCVSNVCRHQNGPLGEGRIVDGCITCPWHGYQYRPESGSSPPPFNDVVPTYDVKVEAGRVLVNAQAHPPGTYVEPVAIPTGTSVPGGAPEPTVPSFRPSVFPSEFYVGYLPASPPSLARHTRRALVTIALLAGGTVVSLALAQAPFADATFEYGHPGSVTGRVRALPYPILDVAENGERRSYLLAGQGKHGAAGSVASFDGQVVRILGTLARRGNARLLEVESIGAAGGATAAEASPRPELLGDFTLSGEIVDSKCWTGVMNPGEGKTHLDCAVRCLSGGLTPMLVVRDSAGHERHLILTDDRGGPMPRTLLPAVGRPVRASGSVNREGRLLFLRAAPGAVRVVER